MFISFIYSTYFQVLKNKKGSAEVQTQVFNNEEINELQSDLNGLKTELEEMKTNLEKNLREEPESGPTSSDDFKNIETKNIANDQTAKISSSSSLKSSDLENEIEFGLKLEDACMCDDQKIGKLSWLLGQVRYVQIFSVLGVLIRNR